MRRLWNAARRYVDRRARLRDALRLGPRAVVADEAPPRLVTGVAHESALLAAHALPSGEAGNHAGHAAALLAGEMELAMYAEAAWPQCSASRPERLQDKEKPEGIDLATWRLQRGIEA